MSQRTQKDSGPLEGDFERDSLIDLASLVIEAIKLEKDGDVIDLYADRLRSHVFTDRAGFEERFLNGYEVMINVLKEKWKKK